MLRDFRMADCKRGCGVCEEWRGLTLHRNLQMQVTRAMGRRLRRLITSMYALSSALFERLLIIFLLKTFLDTFVCQANANGTEYFFFEVSFFLGLFLNARILILLSRSSLTRSGRYAGSYSIAVGSDSSILCLGCSVWRCRRLVGLVQRKVRVAPRSLFIFLTRTPSTAELLRTV